MKTRFNESFYGIPGAEDVDWAIIYKGGKIEPSAFWDELGDIYAEEHPEDINMENFQDWCWDNKDIVQSVLDDFVKNMDDMDDFGDPLLESKKKLVKEGAGAGYDVGISELEIDKVTEVKELEDGDYAFTATIKPGFYEISASDYYNDFFWQEHEFGDTPEAKIDGGVIHGTICPWEDTDDLKEWVRYQVERRSFNLSFMYGGGWSHANLPEDGQLYIDEHIEITPEQNFSIDDIQLDAVDLVQAVNAGYASLDDRYNDEEEDEDGEPMDESYDPKGDDGRKRVMDALEEFRQVLWDDTKVDDEEEHDLRRSLYQDVDNAISQAIQKYFKYSRM